ncbi:MAG: hypothetical protein PHU65_08760 [Actinomycetota bacterium]|nr:hypothetical protein [Actinomycetota bacterium]
MRKFYCIIISLILILGTVFGTVSCASSASQDTGAQTSIAEQTTMESVQTTEQADPKSEVIVFNDPVLEEKIRAAMNKPEGNITVGEAESVKKIDGDIEWQSPEEMMIKDISVLKYFANLEELELQFHAITDISPLAGMIKMKGLALGGNNISDISPLADLKELGFLSLFNCQAKDYSVLKNFNNLFGLHIDYSPFEDLSVLSEMKDLQRLTFVETKVSDVSPIANLTKLKVLKLENCPIEDLSPLKDIYPNLEEKDFELD